MKSTEYETGIYEDKLYFNATRNYTLALLNAFNDVPLYVSQEEKEDKKFTVPITFGNYEKALILEDFDETQITKLNFNFLPRLILTFNGMVKAADRQTQKYQKFRKQIQESDVEFSYNSMAYDFEYTLLLQTRGLTAATQITETILTKFNPSLTLDIQEFPLFDRTETQIQITDPSFEILDDFAENDVNIINVSFDVKIRGNIYSPITIKGTIESSRFYMNSWDKKDFMDSTIAGEFKWDHTTNGLTETITSLDGKGNVALAQISKLRGLKFSTKPPVTIGYRSPGVFVYDWENKPKGRK